MVYATITTLAKAQAALESSVSQILFTTPLHKAKAEATFNGTSGAWRRVGGMNLFLREGDGVIMNGPRALQGQPMSNINSDDFRAISKVKEIYGRYGKNAVPGDDILEVASGTNKTTLTSETAKAIVTKGFGRVAVTLHAQVSKGRYEKVEDKSFKATDELTAFEDAKSWARRRLRATGRNKVQVKGKGKGK